MRVLAFLPAVVICLAAHLVAGDRLAGAVDTDPARAAVRSVTGRQLIVQVARTTQPTGTTRVRSAALAARLKSLGLRLAGGLEDGMPPARSGPRSFAADPARALFDLDPERIFLLEAEDAEAARRALGVLSADREIDWVELNTEREPAGLTLHGSADPGPGRMARPAGPSLDPDFPDDPLFQDSRQWGLRNLGPGSAYGGVAGADIKALDAWSFTTGANDLRLAVADTGIDPDQPELQARFPDGSMRIQLAMNVTSDPSRAVTDSFGHGTLVAGVMAARTHNGPLFDSLGVAGVCGGDGHGNMGCRIVPIKIAPGHIGPATAYDISRAILYAARVGARAMNLSYGGLGPSRLERLALYHAVTHGCVVVAAAGNFAGLNDGADPVYPAAYAAEGLCIQAGASDVLDQRAFFSSHGPGLDLLAPGHVIWTTYMTYPSWAGASYRGYLAASGTSLAAPHVAGAVGLLAALRPDLMDNDFQHVLRESADDVGAPGVDPETGWGRMNAGRALASVRSVFGVWHDEAAAEVFHTLRTDSLVVEETGWGNLARARLWPLADLVEVRATVSVPDSFLDSVRVWPRVGGTTTIRGDFRIPYFAPWARAEWVDGRTFVLRGYLFHLVGCPTCTEPEDTHLPLPPDQARFGFTVIGRVDRPPDLSVLAPAPGARVTSGDTLEVAWNARDPDQITATEIWLDRPRTTTLLRRLEGQESRARVVVPCDWAQRAGVPDPANVRVVALDEHGSQRDHATAAIPIEVGRGPCPETSLRHSIETAPNPFRRSLRIAAPRGTRVSILDVTGRVLRRLEDVEAAGFSWDGRDELGTSVRPGIYLVRCESASIRFQSKVVKLE